MSVFASQSDGDGIPLLTEVVDLDAPPAADPASTDAFATALADESAIQPELASQIEADMLLAAGVPSDVQAQPSYLGQPWSRHGTVSDAGRFEADEILRQFRETWPAVIEAECQDAVQAALRQFSEQLVETLSVHLTITLQARLETWLEMRLRS